MISLLADANSANASETWALAIGFGIACVALAAVLIVALVKGWKPWE